MGVQEDARSIKASILRVVDDEIAKKTADCLRIRKATVTTAPNGTVCGVTMAGDNTALSLPYSSAVSSVSVGDIVWVLLVGSSMRNAIVWQTLDFS